MDAADGPVFGEPPWTRSFMDSGPVLRTLRPGDHRKKTATETFSHLGEALVHIQWQCHTSTVRGPGHNHGQGSRSGRSTTPLGCLGRLVATRGDRRDDPGWR